MTGSFPDLFRYAGRGLLRLLLIGALWAVRFGPARAGDAAHGAELASAWCDKRHSRGNRTARLAEAGLLFTDLARWPKADLNAAINRLHDFVPRLPDLTEADKADLVVCIRALAGP